MTLALFQMHWPSSKLSWELKQELRKGQGARWGTFVNLALPGGTLRYAGGALAAPGLAQYDARVLSLGSITRAISDRDNRIQDLEATLTIDDASLAFASAVEGAQGQMVRGSTVTVVLGSPAVPQAQWFTLFSGVIWAYQMASPRVWQLKLRPNDLVLQKVMPKAVIAQPDWPNADPSVYAQYGPLIYGNHDSSNTTAKGAVPCVYVDKSVFRYLVCWGHAKSVDSVYVAAVKQVSGFTVSYMEVGGRLCTVVTFTGDQGTNAVTVDVQGYETVGDGTGPLIGAPTDAIRHLLTNFVYNDYKTGLWLPESTAPIDAASFNATAVVLARSNARAARRIFGAQVTGIDVLNEWSDSWQTRLFWTNLGKLGCRLEELSSLALYRDDQCGWIRHDRTPIEAPTYVPDWETLLDSVNVDHHFDEASGKYLFSIEVRDPSLGYDAHDALQLPWSAVSTA